MDQDNVLTQGIDGLLTMKDNLAELEAYKKRSKELDEKEDELERQLSMKEKVIADEAVTTVKKRRQEVETSYNEQIEKVKARIKKVKAKREKEKSIQVSERIKLETSDMTETKIRLKEELKSVYQKNQIPAFYNNALFHALYMPRGLKDFGIILLTLAVTLFAIPVGIYYFFLPAGNVSLVIDYVITVVLFGGLYLLFNSKLKEGHAEAVIDIRAIRSKQAKNQKQINVKAKDIRKDKDESTYSLEDFTQEIEKLNEELQSITEEKKDAMVTFETTTKTVIEEGVRAKYQDDVDALKQEHDAAYKDQMEAEEKVKQFSIEVASKYESYVGKDMLTIDKIDRLIAIMQENNLQSISEAIKMYQKETMAQPMQ